MTLDESLLENYTFQKISQLYDAVEDDEEEFEDDEQEEPNEIEFIDEIVEASGLENLTENKRFTEVICENGTKRKMRKPSLVWLLSENNYKLSNDRLKRVQTRKLSE